MVRMENTAIRIGLAAALTMGSLGLFTSTALADDRGQWNQQQHRSGERAERGATRPERATRQAPQQRQAPRQERQVRQERPQQQRQQFEQRRQNVERQQWERSRAQQQPQRQQVDQRRQNVERQQSERFRARQQNQQVDQRRQQNDRQRAQSDRVRSQQQQRYQSDQRRQQAEQQQRQRNDRLRAQQEQRNYGQRPDNRRAADWQNNNRHDPRWNQQSPRRNNYQHYATGNRYRNADWSRWRDRHYVAAPRYHWNYDPYSRPWFDYNRVSYISIYRPTYVIPYNAYQSYGTSYYGPVGCNRDVVGAVLGGVAGGLIGAHNGGGGATVGGAIIGALLGGTLGQAIDMSDQACYGQVLEYAPSNQPVYWESDGAQYQVTPLRTYRSGSGEYCREYQTYIYIDGQEQQAYGTACRQPDGAWRAS